MAETVLLGRIHEAADNILAANRGLSNGVVVGHGVAVAVGELDLGGPGSEATVVLGNKSCVLGTKILCGFHPLVSVEELGVEELALGDERLVAVAAILLDICRDVEVYEEANFASLEI